MPVPYVSVDAPHILVRRVRGANNAAIFAREKARLAVFPTPHRVVNRVVAEG